MAQGNVFSLNIVGYTVNTIGAFTPFGNSLRAAAGTPEQDRLDKVIPPALANEGDTVNIYNGINFDVFTIDLGSGSGYVDVNGPVAAANLPVIGPGVGFMYGNQNIGTTITFVGEVRMGTTVVTLPISPFNKKLTSSPLPYSGAIMTGPLNLQVVDGDNILKFSYVFNPAGRWDVYTRDSGEVTGWLGPVPNQPEPTLLVGEGFIYENNGPTANTWTQTYP
jgi:hypothetical protein